MKFYNITDDYIAYLRKFDSNVAVNKEASRPYIGAVLEIQEVKYFAPLSSPKDKHLKMKNAKDFRKIDNGKLGAINLNNMIPVVDEALIPIEFNDINDLKYQELLRRQYKAIRIDESEIITAASELHTLVLTSDTSLTRYDLRVKSRCCNFALLESLYKSYTVQK